MTELQKAIEVLINTLKDDEGYRLSWQANIAMSFVDRYNQKEQNESIHSIANDSAINFLNLLTRTPNETEYQ